jgi:hypothetical protein
MRKVKHFHDEIVGLLGQRAAMSGSENKLHLAQNHPEMLLQVRYAEHAADFTAKKRKACSEAYQESKAKKQRGLPGVEGEAADPFEMKPLTPLRRREAADALAAMKQRGEQKIPHVPRDVWAAGMGDVQRFFERQALGVPSDEREEGA